MRAAAIDALVKVKPKSRTTVKLLTELLDDRPGTLIPATAARGLQRIGPYAREAAPKLLEKSQVGPPMVREECSFALACVSPTSRQAMAMLEDALASGSSHQQEAAVTVFGYLGTKKPSYALPILLKALDSSNPPLQWIVLDALAGMGAGAREAVPAITRLLDGPSFPLQQKAVRVLGSFGPLAGSALPALRAREQTPVVVDAIKAIESRK